jgi:hypothetical protein
VGEGIAEFESSCLESGNHQRPSEGIDIIHTGGKRSSQELPPIYKFGETLRILIKVLEPSLRSCKIKATLRNNNAMSLINYRENISSERFPMLDDKACFYLDLGQIDFRDGLYSFVFDLFDVKGHCIRRFLDMAPFRVCDSGHSWSPIIRICSKEP